MDVGHTGRGIGQKADDRWALPMTPGWHAKSHTMPELVFWEMERIDPWLLALALWGAYNAHTDNPTLRDKVARGIIAFNQ